MIGSTDRVVRGSFLSSFCFPSVVKKDRCPANDSYKNQNQRTPSIISNAYIQPTKQRREVSHPKVSSPSASPTPSSLTHSFTNTTRYSSKPVPFLTSICTCTCTCKVPACAGHTPSTHNHIQTEARMTDPSGRVCSAWTMGVGMTMTMGMLWWW